GVRVDSGVREGGMVSVHYDPLVAKLIVSAESRALALARMDRALSEFAVLGIHTNVPFLRALVNHPDVRAGRLDTRFIERPPDAPWVFFDGHVYRLEVTTADAPARPRRDASGELSAPMPATVRAVLVRPGDHVTIGQPLVILEAMKMELPLRAPVEGTVQSVR